MMLPLAAYTFQVLGSRLKPGCAENAIDNALLDLIRADERGSFAVQQEKPGL